jgi:hypothetical protein
LVLGLGACTADTDGADPTTTTGAISEPTDDPGATDSTETPETTDPATAPTTEPPTAEPPDERVTFDNERAMRTVRTLSLRVGPREATSDAFARSANWVEFRLKEYGYNVSRQRFKVPAGNSWGVDVPAGTSANVIADPIGFHPTRPHIIIGAHLDTVPQAPGAEDNASGISVMLELARMAAARAPEVPVRFIAFGAEEPRGEGDALHHFGSTRYVQLMSEDEREALMAMVSLDRVGTRGPYVPASSGPGGETRVRDDLATSARALGIDTQLFDDNSTSDHWSFTKAGLPSARLGSIDYDCYHSSCDLPRTVDPTQLTRVGRTMWHWLRSY